MSKELQEQLTARTHDLFLESKYQKWKDAVIQQAKSRWFSLIVELDRQGCDISDFQKFGQDVHSKLVYRVVPGPYFSSTQEVIVLFKLAGSIWSSVINIRPSPEYLNDRREPEAR